MDKKKNTVLAWITAGLAVLGVIILLIATMYAIMHLEIIADECSNFSGQKPYFITAVAIVGVAVGIQLVAIIMAVVGSILNKNSNRKIERSAEV